MSAENASCFQSPDGVTASIQSALAALWCEALSRETAIGPEDDFFTLGGDSLAMTIVLFRVKEVLGIDLPPGALLESPSFASFCGLVGSVGTAGA